MTLRFKRKSKKIIKETDVRLQEIKKDVRLQGKKELDLQER